MSNRVQNSEKEINIWNNLPDTSLLPLYFRRKDLVELSKVSKNYRYQLRHQIFRTLAIPTVKRLLKVSNLKTHDPFNSILYRLKTDYHDKFNLVKWIKLRTTISKRFTADFFTLFPNLTHITVITSNDYNLNDFIEALSKSAKLEYISFESKVAKYIPLGDSINHKFFYKLKSIRLHIPSLVNASLPVDVIDSSFTNLKHLIVINNRMLTKLCKGLPSLISAEFLKGSDFEKVQLANFIRNNPQLKRLSVSASLLNEEVVKSILALNKLYLLNISDSEWYHKDGFDTLAENYCIKHIAYTGSVYNDSLFGILNLCKNLNTYEFLTSNLAHLLPRLIKLPKIYTLLIPHSFNQYEASFLLSHLKSFHKIKFRNGCKYGELFDLIENFKNCCWVPKYEYSRDTNEFTFIRA